MAGPGHETPTGPPAVPLEAGLGPENPPCPACGEPLFGWLTDPARGETVRRCERCGLGVAGEASAVEAREALEADLAGGRVANRQSLQAWLGRGAWAALEPSRRYLFTAEAAGRLAAPDRRPPRVRWVAGASIASMWQTLLNSFTFGRNAPLAALGRAEATPASRPWQRRLDMVIIAVVALPAILVAAPLELGAALARRGGVLELSWD